jgi:hypothetical protein
MVMNQKFTEETIIEIICKNMGLNSNDIMYSMDIDQVTNGNWYKKALTLYDLHEITNTDIGYSENDIDSMFQTIGDIIDFFLNKKKVGN